MSLLILSIYPILFVFLPWFALFFVMRVRDTATHQERPCSLDLYELSTWSWSLLPPYLILAFFSSAPDCTLSSYRCDYLP